MLPKQAGGFPKAREVGAEFECMSVSLCLGVCAMFLEDSLQETYRSLQNCSGACKSVSLVPSSLKITWGSRQETLGDKPRDVLSLSRAKYIPLLCFLLSLSPSYSHGSHLPDRKMKQK